MQVWIIPTNQKKDTAITFEFKLAKSDGEMKNKAVEGLSQIDKKNYRINIPNYVKTMVEVAISFYKKSAFVSARVLQRGSSNWKVSLSAQSKPPQIEVSGSSKRKLDLKDNGDNDKRAQKKFRVEVNEDKRNEEEEEEEEESDSEYMDSENEVKQCEGMTKSGERCKHTVAGSDVCYQHRLKKQLVGLSKKE